MLPETLLRSHFKKHGIELYSELPIKYPKTYVRMVRIGGDRTYQDVGRFMQSKNYRFLLHCISSDGMMKAAILAEDVCDILTEEVYALRNVEQVDISGPSPLPSFDGSDGYTVNLEISLRKQLIN